jgi:alkylation response protein AidB-like acyl-CoA dehydrogenase
MEPLMYRLNEEQTRIVALVAAVADQSIAPHASRVDRDRAFPTESIAALGQAGLLGLTVPSSLGGLGQDLRTMAAALDEVAQRCSSTAMVYLMHLCGVASCVAASEKTASYLQAAARGEHLTTLAFSAAARLTGAQKWLRDPRSLSSPL